LSTAIIAGAGSVRLSKISGNIEKPYQFQIVELGRERIRVHSYEAELKDPGTNREWEGSEYDFEYARHYWKSNFPGGMIAKLAPEYKTAAARDLDRFDSLVNFEALLRGDSKITERVFQLILKQANPAMTDENMMKERYGKRLEEVRKNPDPTREMLRRALEDDSALRLDPFLLREWKLDEPESKGANAA
jgi:hypothetical protein